MRKLTGEIKRRLIREFEELADQDVWNEPIDVARLCANRAIELLEVCDSHPFWWEFKEPELENVCESKIADRKGFFIQTFGTYSVPGDRVYDIVAVRRGWDRPIVGQISYVNAKNFRRYISGKNSPIRELAQVQYDNHYRAWMARAEQERNERQPNYEFAQPVTDPDELARAAKVRGRVGRAGDPQHRNPRRKRG